jgi:rubrerythrin
MKCIQRIMLLQGFKKREAPREQWNGLSKQKESTRRCTRRRSSPVESGRNAQLGPIYVCSVCGYTSEEEIDRCPICGAIKEKVRKF